MNAINGDTQKSVNQQEHEYIQRPRRGRPPGSKNRKLRGSVSGMPGIKITGRPKSLITHRKWQRDWVMPQFVVSRKQAQDMLLKYLRSKPGKSALLTIIDEGFTGLSNLTDDKLGEFLVSTNLLSRYPHEIVIRGV